jgi:DNA polymerase-1
MSSENEKKLFLLDAYALIFRAYYAFIRNPRKTSKGLNTSAIFGFMNSLLEILEKEKPTHIAVAFDPPGPTFRHKMFKEYKAQREATPEDIRKAVPFIKRLLEAFNIPILEVEGYEADDVIGTLSRIASEQGFETYMVTPDKDYAQLVGENVYMYKPRTKGGGNEVWGVEEIKEKFGVERPEQVIDILALWGDTADNIPGGPGVGEKRAKELVANFGSVDGIYENIDKLKGKQKENMVAYKDQVDMSKKLVVIEKNVPGDFNPDDFKAKEPDIEKVMAIMDELEFRNLKDRVAAIFGLNPPAGKEQQGNQPQQLDLFAEAGTTQTSAASYSSHENIDSTKHKYYLVNDDMAIATLRADLSVQKEFCFDTETTSVNAMEAELVGMSFSWEKGMAYYVPVPEDKKDADKLVKSFRTIFEDEAITKTGQNLKYDMLVL